ncbi:isopentenyl pyrophosphate isomerase [Hyaloraphidium curvatum]|nr:isopentenyl pyrophosphate isomerase [Hyaloraphidium curvatum]
MLHLSSRLSRALPAARRSLSAMPPVAHVEPSAVVDLAAYNATQAALMEEMCILVDGADRVVGFDTKKNTHLMANIKKGLLHRAFSVFLFDSQNRLLLQQRADEKITFPGFWTNTCCSHPLNRPDELEESADHVGVKRAAVRKLEHELGIRPGQVPMDRLQFLTRIHYLAPSDGMWGEHEVDYVFLIKADVDLDLNPNEVQAVRFVSQDELKDLFRTAGSDGTKITPWFRLIVESFLYKWWDRIDDLAPLRDDEIHKL